jgi:preprotein translocase subunit SecF
MNFLKLKPLYFLISGVMLLIGGFSLVKWGLRPAVDFTGGSLVEFRFEKEVPGSEQVTEVVKDKGWEVSSVQPTGERGLMLRLPPLGQGEIDGLRNTFKEKTEQEVEEVRFESVGPTLGRELLTKTGAAVAIAAGFILLYVAWAFKDKKYGVCAILAMFHDSLVMVGVFSLLGHFLNVEVDTLFVTALLTTLSFSVHDTVVVYDRIRESVKRYPSANFRDLANKALTETMTRSLNNSFTIMFMLAALLLLGGSTIKWFALALLVGTIAGTYSSPFVAVPLLETWEGISARRRDKTKD